jgi:tRNA 2-thiouridine synthesizing protein A
MDSNLIEHHHEWHAGDLGCGELVLGVRKRLRAHPGQVLKLTAFDTAAAIDLQAFCNMTSDELLALDTINKTFWLRGREK